MLQKLVQYDLWFTDIFLFQPFKREILISKLYTCTCIQLSLNISEISKPNVPDHGLVVRILHSVRYANLFN